MNTFFINLQEKSKYSRLVDIEFFILHKYTKNISNRKKYTHAHLPYLRKLLSKLEFINLQ